MSWEETFQSWAKPPGETEQTKCDNAVRAVRKAIETCTALNGRDTIVFPQGSYRNRTNVRADSDVDICVLCRDSFFFHLPEGKKPADYNFHTPADYPYSEYKNDVHTALVSYFEQSSVSRGNKAFDIHENTYRVDADVVASFEYRWYYDTGDYRMGTAFDTDRGARIINYPQQNYDNGVEKNEATDRRFKAVVRILKRLCGVMAEEGFDEAAGIPSFLIECLTWNVPNEGFGHDAPAADVRWSLAHLFNNTRKPDACSHWLEINGYKYLFRSSQPWTMERAHGFVSAAWDYLGFE